MKIFDFRLDFEKMLFNTQCVVYSMYSFILMDI